MSRPNGKSNTPKPSGVLRLAVCFLLLHACGGSSPQERHEALPRGQKDVVVILVDTLRADRLGAYGYDRGTSPYVDAFAGEAILFEQCVSQSTWTKPSVASLMTGLLPGEHGVHRTGSPLDARLTTVAERLRERGYQSAGFVSNQLVSGPKHGMGQGFDVFEGKALAQEGDLYPRAQAIVDRSIEWLGAASSDPMFLYVHLYDPHAPYDPPAPHRERFDRGFGGAIDGSYNVNNPSAEPEDLSADDWEHWRDLYDAEVAYADEHVGRLLAALKQEARFDDALVVFLSDHGEEFFEHGDWGHNPHMYQEVVHVPLIVKPPASFDLDVGVRVDRLAMQIDFVPTILDLVGAEPDSSLLGASWFARALLDSEALPATAYSEVQHHGHIRRGVFEGFWKRVRADAPAQENLLFHLQDDPREELNRFSSPATPLRHLDGVLSGYEMRGPRTKSLAIQFSNGGPEERRLVLHVASSPALVGLDPFGTEEKADTPAEFRDGPLVVSEVSWEGTLLSTTSISFCLPPGDTDRVSVDLSADSNMVWIHIEGQESAIDESRILLGAEGTSLPVLPLRIDLTDPSLVRNEPGQDERATESASQAPGLAGLIWLVPGGGLRPIDLSADERAKIEQLGYAADD